MPRLKNRRHERFCKEYVRREFNASAAARAVGYSVISAQNQGYRLMMRDDVLKRVAELSEDINDDGIMSAEEVLQRATQLASFDPAKLYDEEGRLMPVHELDEDVTVAINEIKTEAIEVTDPVTGERKVINVPTEIKAGRDTKFGLDLLSKYHNLLEDHQKSGAAINTIYIDEKDAQA